MFTDSSPPLRPLLAGGVAFVMPARVALAASGKQGQTGMHAVLQPHCNDRTGLLGVLGRRSMLGPEAVVQPKELS
jgi:hypothetical protein